MPFSATRDLWLVLKARDESNKALRSFSTNIRDVGRQVEIAQALANKADAQRQLSALRASGASKAQIDDAKNLVDAYDKQARSLKVLDMKQEEHRRKTLMLGQSMQSVSQVTSTMGLVAVAAGVSGLVAIKKLTDVSIEYNRTVALTRTQVDGFKASLQDLSKEGLDVANSIGVPFEGIQKTLYDIFSSTNANLAQSKILLEAFAKTAVAGQVDLQDASRGTMAILNAFHIPIEQVTRVLDIEFQLVRKGVGTYEEFSKVIGRVAPSANRAGQSVETMAAMLTFLTRNGLSAAMAAASAGRALDAFSNARAVQALENLGIKMKGVKGEFLPLIDIIQQISDKFKHLTGPQRAAKIQSIFAGAGGTIQARRFIDQVIKPGEVDRFRGFLTDMQHATGQFGNAYEQMANTSAVKTQMLANKWKVLQVTAGNILTPVFLKLIDAANAVLNWFNKLDPSTQRLIVLGMALAAAFSVVLGVILFVVAAFAAIAGAIAVAGGAFFVITGIITGAVAAFIALAAVIAIAYKNSIGFREIILEAQDDIKRLYTDAILPVAQGIKNAWDKYMGPAFTKMADIIEHWIIPTFIDLKIRIVEPVIPAIREAGMIVKSGLVLAFRFFGAVIRSVVIPAIIWLIKQYDEHQNEIQKIMPAIKQSVKWMLILAAVIVGVLIGGIIAGTVALAAIIAAFVAAGVAIVAVVALIAKLVSWLKVEVPKALHATGNFFVKVWQDIASFFVGIWNGIVNFLQSSWNFITSMFNLAMTGLSQLWDRFWNGTIGRLITAVWNFIVATVQFGIAAVEFAVLWSLRGLQNLWEMIWSQIGDTVKAVWNTITILLLGVWNFIKSNAISIWNDVAGFFTGIWQRLVVGVKFWWNVISILLSGVWNSIKSNAISIWNGIFGAVSGVWSKIVSFFKAGWDGIFSFVSGLVGRFTDAGKNIVQGLIDGMTSKINGVTDKIKEIVKKIRDHLPFSPAKVGPLSGRGNPYYSGQAISTLLSKGMQSKIGLITNAAGMVAGASMMNGSANYIGANNNAGSSNYGSSVNQTFNIITNEINPRRHSAELGFALAARL